jgi:hypothetical protein
MEPVTTVLGALAAGAIAVTKDAATDAIKSAFSALKDLIVRRLGGAPSATAALVDNADKPEMRQALQRALAESGGDKDQEIFRNANELLKLLKEAGLGGATVVGSGAAVSGGGVAAGQGGIAVGRDLYGDGGKRKD